MPSRLARQIRARKRRRLNVKVSPPKAKFSVRKTLHDILEVAFVAIVAAAACIVLLGAGALVGSRQNPGKNAIAAQNQQHADELAKRDKKMALLDKRSRVLSRMHVLPMNAHTDFGAPEGVLERKDVQRFKAYINRQANALNITWQDYFENIGLQEPKVKLHFVEEGKTGVSKCDPTVRPTALHFYCSADTDEHGNLGAIWWPLVPLQPDDVTAMSILLHEYGHHIQFEIAEQLGLPGIGDVEGELIAECMVGVMVPAFYATMNNKQIAKMHDRMSFTGDSNHGTSDQRLAAYRLGLEGKPIGCIHRYWTTW